MAFINDLYIFAEKENVEHDFDLPSHPTETGIDLTDHVRPKAREITVKGEIIDNWLATAADTLDRLVRLAESGAMVGYIGRNAAWQMQIASISRDHTKDIANGMDVSITLRQARIAKDSYDNPDTPTSTSSSQKGTDVAVGGTAVFKGGAVYKSSDAKKASSNKGRSTCKVTHVKTSAEHPYHLESTDGAGVFGWVNADCIELPASNDTKAESKAGVKQTESASGNVYHVVRSGDTVYKLVNGSYKSLGTSCSWVIENNPQAFSVPGNPRTLIVGARLLMGIRK